MAGPEWYVSIEFLLMSVATVLPHSHFIVIHYVTVTPVVMLLSFICHVTVTTTVRKLSGGVLFIVTQERLCDVHTVTCIDMHTVVR